jgi:hypothetical protein
MEEINILIVEDEQRLAYSVLGSKIRSEVVI